MASRYKSLLALLTMVRCSKLSAVCKHWLTLLLSMRSWVILMMQLISRFIEVIHVSGKQNVQLDNLGSALPRVHSALPTHTSRGLFAQILHDLCMELLSYVAGLRPLHLVHVGRRHAIRHHVWLLHHGEGGGVEVLANSQVLLRVVQVGRLIRRRRRRPQ